MKATAKAPANIAFIKYWGKKDSKLRIPANNSVSMNLSNAHTTTTVEFNNILNKDTLFIDNKKADSLELGRAVKHLDKVRKIANFKLKAKVTSFNSFPKGTGIASSASAFAALSLASTKAAGLNLSVKELSVLARLGSGSACRSIPDGFVEWKAGSNNENSHAHSLHPANYWDIQDIVVVVGSKHKKVSSTSGHTVANSSPFYETRIANMKQKVTIIKQAIRNKNFTTFGETVESEAVNMHTIMMTSKPALYYWLPETIKIMQMVIDWREMGLESYFTLDAGPNIHIICKKADSRKIIKRLEKATGIKKIILNDPAPGAKMLQ